VSYAEDQERLAREAVAEQRAALEQTHARRQERLARRQADPASARSEASIQEEFISWCDLHAAIPGREALGLVFHIPNGGKREKRMYERRDGSASWWSPVGEQLRRMGARAGVPDLCVPVPFPALGFGAMYIEVKKPGGRLSAEQRTWHGRLMAAGNRVITVDSVDELKDEVCVYLGLGDWRTWEVVL
jgi:hypothetical protein